MQSDTTSAGEPDRPERAEGPPPHAESSRPQDRIRPRRIDHSFDPSIPKHWFGGNAVASHVVNGVNLLFPHGERFFIRSVRRYLDQLDEPELVARVRAFFGQEGHHAREHQRFFALLEAQGYEIGRFLDRYHRWMSAVERAMPAKLRLAVTAAAEHFTATLAEVALEHRLFGVADPTVAGLLLWHAAEEIEHKSVAFDVLQRVDSSYGLRVLGLATASVLLAGWWMAATRMLLRQDGIGRAERRRQRAGIRAVRKTARGGVHNLWRDVFVRGIREYLRRDFHPDDHDNYHLALEYLTSIGRAEG